MAMHFNRYYCHLETQSFRTFGEKGWNMLESMKDFHGFSWLTFRNDHSLYLFKDTSKGKQIENY